MSRGFRGSRIVIYPAYLDANLTRREGRRVPLHMAVPNPSIESIVSACKDLGLNPEVEVDKKYPRDSLRAGRIVVDKRESKLKTIYMIAQNLKTRQKSR